MSLTAFLLFLHFAMVPEPENANAILGKWEDMNHTLRVEVYRSGDEFRAKLIWFNDGDPRPLEDRTDENNPDKNLRKRRLLNLELVTHLFYNPASGRWEMGKIYDSTSGRFYDASAWLQRNGLLNVRGFWHFGIFGRNLLFRRV